MNDSDHKFSNWQVLSETELLRTSRMQVVQETVRLQSGVEINDYYQIHMAPASVIAPRRKDGRYILLKMYKHGPRRVGIGFPGGGVEPGEDPLAAAQRELLEETGYKAQSWRKLGGYTVHSNQECGFCHFFAAFDAELTQEPIADDLEPHEFVYLTRQEMLDAVQNSAFLSMGHVCMAGLLLTLVDP